MLARRVASKLMHVIALKGSHMQKLSMKEIDLQFITNSPKFSLDPQLLMLFRTTSILVLRTTTCSNH